MPDFRTSWLWQHAFVDNRVDASSDEQDYFRDRYLAMRSKVEQLVTRISADMPQMTVHDITHLDALWDTASLVAEGNLSLNPPEAFVFGASVLLHDSAMTLAAFPGGRDQIMQTTVWKDIEASYRAAQRDAGTISEAEMRDRLIPDTLRRLHAEHAEVLAEQKWRSSSGEDVFLLDDADLRHFYGPHIGKIAHSHWWPVSRVETEFGQDLGAFSLRTRNLVDRVKVACLLRVADVLHLDQRRAPRFLRTINPPTGISEVHWSFQERIARPHIEHDAVVFTSGQPFDQVDAEAWWLAYDTLLYVDQELRDVDLLLRSRNREVLRGRRVKGAGSTEAIARMLPTKNWRPVDARLRISDIPRIVATLGGAKLYGDDPTIALRELIQNSADAIQARRKLQNRLDQWGRITVELYEHEGSNILAIEDNGIGMSEQVMTGPLIDFGTSFWRSALALEEFPGLAAKGMDAIGRYGIGFFSVFMLGASVRVISKRFDKGDDHSRTLTFKSGTSSRPMISASKGNEIPLDGGTRVEVILSQSPGEKGGLLYAGPFRKEPFSLRRVVGSLAPNLDVELSVREGREEFHTVATPRDWVKISDHDLLLRLYPSRGEESDDPKIAMRPLIDSDGTVFGRAAIVPGTYYGRLGWVTVGGLRAARLNNIEGVLTGEALTASRNSACPSVPVNVLRSWATQQAGLVDATSKDEEVKAKVAEIVLRCGGEIGRLPIVQHGKDWLNAEQFIEAVRNLPVVDIEFTGGFSYDEDSDNVHPRDFKDGFQPASDIFVVPSHDSTILQVGTDLWPDSQLGKEPSRDTQLTTYVRSLIMRVWDEASIENRIYRQVGEVNDEPISRYITRMTRISEVDRQRALNDEIPF